MSLVNAGLLAGTTAVSYTGGAALSFSEKVRDKANLVVHALADAFSVRRKISFNFREAKVRRASGTFDANSAYTQQRATATFTLPVTVTDPISAVARTEYNTIQITVSQHPLTPAASKQELRFVGSQLLSDADITPFFDDGNMG